MTYYIYAVTGGLCCYFSCINLLPKAPVFYKRLILVLYFTLSMTFFYTSLGQFATYLVIAGGVTLLTYFSTDRRLCAAMALIGYPFSVTCNQLFLWFVSILLNINADQMKSSETLLVILSISYCFICYGITKLLGWLLRYKFGFFDILKDFHFPLALLAELAVLTTVFIFNISYGEQLGYSYGVMSFNSVLFMLLFFMTGLMIVSIYRQLLKEQQLKEQLTQYENFQSYVTKLEESNDTIRRFKHDYINILSTMSGYIDEGGLPELQQYFHNKILPLKSQLQESDSRLGLLAYVKPMELKSLLSFKLAYSMEHRIDTRIEITEPIETIPMDVLELSRILGIFLDNAIEAASESPEKRIDFSMFYQEGKLCIITANSTLPLELAIGQLAHRGISNKGENRGIGLYHVSQILDRYPDILWSMQHHEPYFIQSLTIPIHKEE